jgi:hypothetical protein
VTFTHGTATRVLANERSVSGTIAGWSIGHQRAVSEVTTVVEGGNRYVPGLMSGTVTLRGPQDSTGQDLHGEIAGAAGVDNALLVTCLPYGTGIGQFAFTVLGDVTEHAIDASVSDAVGFTMSAMADESVDMGFVAHALVAETADGNGAAVDRGAGSATTGGAVAAMHVTAFSGLTGALIKVQHSTDNSTWADLVSFTNVTGISAERKFLTRGTTINRYVRVVTDVTGTGSVTFLVTFCPR